MNASLRRFAWIVAFLVAVALVWFALSRRTASRAASIAQPAAPALVHAPPPDPPRKTIAPKIAAQARAPELPAHSLPGWDVPLEESVAELRKWSDAGDTDAQFQLTSRLEPCSPHRLKQAKKLDDIDRGNIEADNGNPRIADDVRASNREFFQSRIDRNARVREACARLPKDLLDRWLDPADRAAQAGNVMAMLTYAKAAFGDYEDVASVAADIDEVVERRDKARAYLEEAARRGNGRALVMLAELHSDASVVETKLPIYAADPMLAYAYAYAASWADGVTPIDRKNLEWLMPYSAAALDAQTLVRAQAEGERLYQQCCARH